MRTSSNNTTATRLPSRSLTSAPSSPNSASTSRHRTLPLVGRAKIRSRVRWCFRFILHMVPESGTVEIDGCGGLTFEFTGPRGFRAHVCSMSSAGNDPRAFTAPSMTPAKPKWRRSSRPHRRCRRGGWPGWRSNIPRWFHGLSDIPTSSTPLYRRRNSAPWVNGTPGKPLALQPNPPASRPNTSMPLGSKCRPG